MATEPTIDYKAVIADLRARKAQMEAHFDAAISSMEAISSSPILQAISGGGTLVSASANVVGNGTGTPGVIDIQNDTFFNMTMVGATKKYLAMKKRPAQTSEIVDALSRGGLPTANGDNFSVVVTTGLHREASKEGSPIVKVTRGTWGLSEWY